LHQAPVAIDACRYFGSLIIGLVDEKNNSSSSINKDNKNKKEEILSPFPSSIEGYWNKSPLDSKLTDVINGSFKRLNPPDIKGSRYVLKTLEAALWAFYSSNTFEEGCSMAVNLGDDADTTGAIYGQLAGAFYGETGIPMRWLSTVAHKDKIIEMADNIYRLPRV
jgi:ADP-ribosylglycohydrolase